MAKTKIPATGALFSVTPDGEVVDAWIHAEILGDDDPTQDAYYCNLADEDDAPAQPRSLYREDQARDHGKFADEGKGSEEPGYQRPGTGDGARSYKSTLVESIRKPDGGFTLHTITGEEPTTGFALSLIKGRETVVPVQDLTLATLVRFAMAHADVLSKDGNYFGAWHNPADGKVYLDVSTVTQDRAEAERLGVEHDQLAYFDLRAGQSVELPRKVKGLAMAAKLALYLAGPATGRVTLDDLTALYRQLTGKEPTDEDLREAAALLRTSAAPRALYREDQARAPKGDPEGGQFVPEGGGTPRGWREVGKEAAPAGWAEMTTAPQAAPQAEPTPPPDTLTQTQIERGALWASPGSAGVIPAHQVRYAQLKERYAVLNNELLRHQGDPNSAECERLLTDLKAIVKESYTLQADSGGIDGLRMPGGPRDLVIVGAGPGGLAAGIMAGTESLDTLVLDAAPHTGGQAAMSFRIENYPGFPAGINGRDLMGNMHQQALRVGAEVQTNSRVVKLEHDTATDIKRLTLEDGRVIEARVVVLAGGIKAREWDVPGAEEHRKIYGDGQRLAAEAMGQSALILGGSNGAAQAGLGTSAYAETTIVSRSPVAKGMSDLQVQAIGVHDGIDVIENDSVVRMEGPIAHLASGRTVKAYRIGVFLGGAPDTSWLPASMPRTGGKLNVRNAALETDISGVFAIGDMRDGAIGRIGTSVGDGQMAVRGAFEYFARMTAGAARAAPITTEEARVRGVAGLAAKRKAKPSRATLTKEWRDLADDLFVADRLPRRGHKPLPPKVKALY